MHDHFLRGGLLRSTSTHSCISSLPGNMVAWCKMVVVHAGQTQTNHVFNSLGGRSRVQAVRTCTRASLQNSITNREEGEREGRRRRSRCSVSIW